MQNGAARYRQASQAAVSARETEIAAFTAVTRELEAAATDKARVLALGRNHSLWSILAKDLALDRNGLPAALKTELISLALWAMRYSTLALLRDLPLAPLIEVNRNITEGLMAQTTQTLARSTFTTGRATA